MVSNLGLSNLAKVEGASQISKKEWVSLCKKAKGETERTCKMIRMHLKVYPSLYSGKWGKVYDKLKNKKLLFLHGLEISDISPLAGFTKLESLSITQSHIVDLSPLLSLINLRDLDLSYNNITDISLVSKIENLEKLVMIGNGISDLSPLRELTNLKNLDLGYNRIVDVSPLADLKGLRELYLDGNYIFDLFPLLNLHLSQVSLLRLTAQAN